MVGAAGGVVSTTLTYPLITVSSRMQVQKNDKHDDAYKNFVDGVQKILKKEGPKGLFSGLSSALFGIAVTNGVYYYWYETVKAAFVKASNKNVMSTGENMLAGAVAGAATVMITNPIWVVNTRMTTKKDSLDESGEKGGASSSSHAKKKKAGALATFLQIVQEDGPGALWQGLIPALILVINPIIQYTVFEQTKARLERIKGQLGSLDFFVLGALSKLAATSITYPYIVVKSRMQLRQSKTDDSARYNSVFDGFQKILRKEGVKGLYKGIETKLVQSVLTAALLFTAKEELFQYSVWLLTLLGLRAQKAAVKH
ncbi:hypothetical protein RI367_004202 [Sorochytrium milnesiophthora]